MFKIGLTIGFSQWQEIRKTTLNRLNSFIIISVPKQGLRNKVIGRFFTNRPLQSSAVAESTIRYLKATRLKVGLLINFGSKAKLEWKRYILT